MDEDLINCGTSIVVICRIVSLLNVDLTNTLTGTMMYADFLSPDKPTWQSFASVFLSWGHS
jgi:hypothetical protein